MAKSFMEDFRRFFVRGLAAILPAILTVAILVWLFVQIQKFVGQFIGVGAQWVCVQFLSHIKNMEISLKGNAEVWDQVLYYWDFYHLGWVSFLLAFLLIYIIGRFVASILGRGIWRTVERAFFRVPLLRQIYPYIKQVVDFLFSERKLQQFSRVVAVEYPRKGIYSLGLVTGPAMRTLQDKVHEDLLTVFIPSSPTPITGYTITVRRHEVIDLPISLDDALRFTISGGVIMPISEQCSEAEIERVRQGLFPLPPLEANKENNREYSD